MNDIITVTQLNRYVCSVLEADSNLSGVFVKGEISSLKRYSSGHLYFTLKDEQAAVSCVMFRSAASAMTFDPRDGIQVVVYAKASLYDRDGKFQLYVSSMKQEGQGNLYLAFEQLKLKLQAEGLFDLARKKKIPYLPRRIGVVTSPSGAVIRDMIHVLGRRFPNFNMVLIPTLVQGATAARSIADAIEEFNRRGDVDVLIVGRGGGSMEDLWCFNEEIVARAVSQSVIPVISAVGHETDYTICDFAADLRAPTPSAAAELVMPVRAECLDQISQKSQKLVRLLENKLEYSKLKMKNLQQNPAFLHPENMYNRKREAVDGLQESMNRNMARLIEMNRRDFNHTMGRLDALSPLKVLQRGYSVTVSKKDAKVIHFVSDTAAGEEIVVRVTDGELDCTVNKIS